MLTSYPSFRVPLLQMTRPASTQISMNMQTGLEVCTLARLALPCMPLDFPFGVPRLASAFEVL